MEVKTPYQLATERAALEGSRTTFEAENTSVRSLVLNTIPLEEPFVIPNDYQLFKIPMRGTDKKALKVITEEGYDFWVSCLTRGAKDANTGEYIPASGTVVDVVQKFSKMSEAFEEIKGKPIQFTKKTEVDVVYNGEPSKVNVFQIDFVKNAKK